MTNTSEIVAVIVFNVYIYITLFMLLSSYPLLLVSACNESIPDCTNCSSKDLCLVFGPMKNLTCHGCEKDNYVGEDQAS